MNQIQEIKELLSSTRKNIVITTHHKPDGDALGSSLALYYFLTVSNHYVNIIVPSDFPENLTWLPSCDKIIIYTENRALAEQLTQQADLIFCLDFNHTSRVNEYQSALENAKASKIMIDHHLEPQGFDDFRFSDTHASSTAELVYKFILALGKESAIDETIATCIYTGILTDTGSFKFASATAEVYRIAASLIDKGVKHWLINQLVYDNSPENRLRFLGYALYRKLTIIPEYHAAYIDINNEELQKFQIQTGETDGLVNYALSIKGVKLAALIIDRSKQVKISIRSIGEIPANEICKNYFNGGGHKNASGGNSNESLEKVVQTFVNLLPTYKEVLENN